MRTDESYQPQTSLFKKISFKIFHKSNSYWSCETKNHQPQVKNLSRLMLYFFKCLKEHFHFVNLVKWQFHFNKTQSQGEVVPAYTWAHHAFQFPLLLCCAALTRFTTSGKSPYFRGWHLTWFILLVWNEGNEEFIYPLL